MRILLLAALPFLAACPVGVDPIIADRNVPVPAAAQAEPVAEPVFQPAGLEDLHGVWASHARTGSWADAGLHYLYVFNRDGTWHSSVLVEQDGGERAILVLTGDYTMDGSVLQLGAGAPPQEVQTAEGRLTLDSELGRIELRAIDLPIW